jgi:hypothetical protein
VRPVQFPDLLFGQLHIQVEAGRWRDGHDRAEALNSRD